MTNIQQQKEKNIIRPVLKSLNIAEDCIINSDQPDIIIPNYNGKRIGIEIVECHPINNE